MLSPKEITIYDIAKEAGVSPATVSRVLTNSPGVRPEKRERVKAIIDKYNFTPNVMAKSLSETRRHMMGMLCADVRNPYFAGLFVQCEHAAYEQGYTVMLSNSMSNEKLELAFLEKMCEQRMDAILISGGTIDWLKMPKAFQSALDRIAAHTPVIVAGRVNNGDCYQVAIDHADGMRQAVSHLASLGHTRIAYLSCAPHINLSQEKRAAFYMAMNDHGLKVREEYVIEGKDFSEFSGVEGMNKMLSLPEKPTAVIGINDMMITGAMQSIMRLGYTIPGDFSLIGFDNSFITDLVVPSITSIKYHYGTYGQRLIGVALDAIEGKHPPKLTMVKPSLVIKNSCKKI